MPEKGWKYQERRAARLLNARRNPHGDPSAPDAENAALAIEVKTKRKLPEWLVAAVLQSKSKAKKEQLPIVALLGRDSPIDLVVLDLKDYQEWYVGTPRRQRR